MHHILDFVMELFSWERWRTIFLLMSRMVTFHIMVILWPLTLGCALVQASILKWFNAAGGTHGNKEKAEGLEEFNKKLDAVNEAIKLNREVHLLFILVGVYLAILFGSTTHKQLLLESDVSLPLLNVGMPIVQMYAWIPWGWLLLHFNILLLMFMLASQLGKLREYAHVCPEEPDLPQQTGMEHIRSKLYVFPFPHWVIGAHPFRLVSFFLGLYVVATTLVLPMALLVWAQVRFLPYQDEDITHLHRWAIGLDLLMLWIFWPLILRAAGKWPQEGQRFSFLRTGCQLSLPLSGFLLFFTVFVAVIPMERLEQEWAAGVIEYFEKKGMERSLKVRNEVLVKELPAPDLVAAFVGKALDEYKEKNNTDKTKDYKGEKTPEAGETEEEKSTLAGEMDPYDSKKKEEMAWVIHSKGLELWGRNFRNADFSNSKMYGVDFFDNSKGQEDQEAEARGELAEETEEKKTEREQKKTTDLRGATFRGTRLQNADLQSANLQGATLSGASLQKATLYSANMQGANLFSASLQGANLFSASLQGADLNGALLQWAVLIDARLQGANLSYAHMQGADLKFASLQGANLSYAHMQGADLNSARLQGADLTIANLQGAHLVGANLHGAKLNYAHMQGANLNHAYMQEANLNYAHMQGAYLSEANLQGANLSGAYLQGANLSEASLQGANLSGAYLQGVISIFADLQGADLGFAHLQGADLSFAHLQGADLTKTALFVTSLNGATLDEAELRTINWRDFDKLTEDIWLNSVTEIPDERSRERAQEQVKKTVKKIQSAPKDARAVTRTFAQATLGNAHMDQALWEMVCQGEKAIECPPVFTGTYTFSPKVVCPKDPYVTLGMVQSALGKQTADKALALKPLLPCPETDLGAMPPNLQEEYTTLPERLDEFIQNMEELEK